MGAVTPGDDPGRYLRCLKYVYEAYRCLPEKPVLIVNTMGWNKGLCVSVIYIKVSEYFVFESVIYNTQGIQ